MIPQYSIAHLITTPVIYLELYTIIKNPYLAMNTKVQRLNIMMELYIYTHENVPTEQMLIAISHHNTEDECNYSQNKKAAEQVEDGEGQIVVWLVLCRLSHKSSWWLTNNNCLQGNGTE